MLRSVALLVIATAVCGIALAARAQPDSADAATLLTLPPALAQGVRLDTLLIGGYASGRFVAATGELASDLSDDERQLVGEHLDRIFTDRLGHAGLGDRGRLRVAYERAVGPDGATRSIRVLSAEVAAGGRLHTAFYFERDGRPGYFDPFGAPVDADSWSGPLRELRVSSPFGRQRLHPILNRVLPHTGVDFAARAGEPVRATADGIVVSAGRRGGYGLLVELGHPNGYGTRYAHLQRIAPGIESARLVRQGEIIGYVGMTGLATGPHLHYEVRRRGQPVDPIGVTGTAGALGPDPADGDRWPRERRLLTELLARTPTMVRAASAPAPLSR